MGAVRTADCERTRARVSLSLDGELSEIEQVSLRAHVGRCAECSGFERDLSALTKALRAAILERPAVGARLPHRRSTSVRVLQTSAVAAAVVLAAAFGTLAGSLSSTDRPGPDGGGRGSALDRGTIAVAHGQQLSASRIRSSVAL
jgi:predicted anti-sigma-YlaC factor YlaD